MLIDTIKKSYRDLIGRTDPVQPIVTVPGARPAANASNFNQAEVQARRLRRQRRLERSSLGSNSGWKVRAW